MGPAGGAAAGRTDDEPDADSRLSLVCADPPEWIAPYSVSPETFSAHLDAVAASGRQPLTVSQYAGVLRGSGSLPPRAVLITVDDGFADFADHILPALAARKMPSTLYVTTGALEGRRAESVLPPARMLRSTDLPGLEAAGVEIGAHSHTHRQLDVLPAREVERELSLSGALLAEWLGHGIRSFAYPHGYWRPGILPLVRGSGVRHGLRRRQLVQLCRRPNAHAAAADGHGPHRRPGRGGLASLAPGPRSPPGATGDRPSPGASTAGPRPGGPRRADHRHA